MIEPGALLQNRYRVTKQIGQGGMGAVYVATDERFHSTVAIKQTFFDDPALRKAFEREAHLLNHLRHVALPRVSDHFVEGEGQFLVMEFIEGDELAELLQQRGAFPLADVLRWADELLDALDYLHTHEPPIVHRDIKPQNMKLTSRGQIVLLDFGLAKGAATATRASATASVFGYSRSYAPLEQIQGTGTDTRSDLYSLGATLYHLLTGIAPTDGLTRAGAVINNQPDPLRPAHLAHAQVPESISRILHRAMALKAVLRPATAAEMRAALRQATSVLPRTTLQAAASQTYGQHARHEATVLAEGTQIYAGQGAAPSTLSQTRLRGHVSQTQSEATIVDSSLDLTRPSVKPYAHASFHAPETPPARKNSPAMIIGIVLCVLVACAFVAVPMLRSPAALPVESGTQTGIQSGAPVEAQPVAPGTTQSEAALPASNPASGQTLSPSSNSRPSTGESQPQTGQLTSGETVTTGNSTANSDGSKVSSPAVEASAGKSGLVIQSPASSSPSANNSAAEYDAQRAEDLRRRKEQQELELQRQRQREQEGFRPPPPPHHGGGFPPPGGEHRPPPHRPPLFR
jgi:serine/threonine protein kinase